jgi:cell surface protein SprA
MSSETKDSKSLGFNTNNKAGGKNKPFYHISNWTGSYGYSEVILRDININHNILQIYTGALAYNYNISPKNISPFSKSKLLKKKAFQIIKDINFYYSPSTVSFRNEVRKSFNEIQLRNIENPELIIDPTFDKQFNWKRTYDVRYNLTRDFKITYNAENTSWVEEPYGRIDKQDPLYQQKVDTVWNSIKNLGKTTDFTQRITLNWQVPINKLPFLDWTSANARYDADFFWTYTPELADTSINIGNTIRNAQNMQLSGQLNLTRLYTKVKYLKDLDNKFERKTKNNQVKYKDITSETDKFSLKKGRTKTITHNLNYDNVNIIITDETGKEIKAQTEIINANKIKITAIEDITNAKIVVTGKKEIKDGPLKIISDNTLYAMMALRNISVSYTQNNGTVVPGYMPKTKFFGFNENWTAPGWEFLTGQQNPNFGALAAQNGWLSGDSLINSPIINNREETYDIRATLTPIKGFKIDVTANKKTSQSIEEYWVLRNGEIKPENKFFSGNFSISVITLKTAFKKINDSTYQSEVYDAFLANRIEVADRLASNRAALGTTYNPSAPNLNTETGLYENNGYPNGYSSTSQEVLIPAFLAAYTGRSVNSVSTNPFPSIPIPNWRVKYDGLSDIEFVKRAFKRISINHGYTSSYRVSSYQSNSFYDFEEASAIGMSFVRDENSELFIPEYQLDGIAIDEKFVPLFGIDMTLKNDMSTKFEYKQARSIALSFANNQILEAGSKEYTVGVGYKIPKLEIPISVGGQQQLFKSDLNLRLDLTYRDMITIVRRINEADNQMSAGQKNFSLKINADYNLNKVTIRLFYDQTVNTPRVSTSYRTSNTKVGFSIRFNLANI